MGKNIGANTGCVMGWRRICFGLAACAGLHGVSLGGRPTSGGSISILPAMITVTWMRSQLGKGGEFQTFAKSDLLPLMKEAGMKFFFVAQAVFGGSSSDYAVFTSLASWAVLDGPGPLMSMGEEAYQRYRTKRNALMVSREENVYRFCEDMSYLTGV
jgi:hypothetical protein